MNGADVVLEITNHGTTADVVAHVTAKSGNTYYQKYLGIAIDGDLYYCFTVDGSYIEIKGTPVGNVDNSTGFWGAHSEPVKVEEGTTKRVYFKNYTSGGANWNNYVVVLQNVAKDHAANDTNGYKEYAVVRADNYGWGDGYATATLETNADADWAVWLSDMNGADVVLDITNKGTTADVVATVYAKSGAVYTQKYLGITIDGDLYYCLTVDASFIDIIGSSVGNLDNSTGFWGAHSEPVKVESGETVNVKFRNYTSGGANWNNYVVVLQNVAKDHAANDTNGYKEYAVVRADNYGWGDGYATATLETNADADWALWLADMNGALVDLSITNNGTTADVVANVTAKNGNTYYQKYLGIAIDGDLYYCFTVDASSIKIFE